MVNRTYQGAICPHCRSLVPEGAKKCPVCKKMIEENSALQQRGVDEPLQEMPDSALSPTGVPAVPTRRPIQNGEVACKACGAYNENVARYCKVCGAKIGKEGERKRGGGGAILQFKWSRTLTEGSLPQEISLLPVHGYSLLGGSSYGLEVLVSVDAYNSPLVFFSANPEGKERFFLRLQRPTVLESGAIFYLGMVAFELRGRLEGKASLPSTLPNDGKEVTDMTTPFTVMAGPGEKLENAFSMGPPTLILPEMAGAHPIGPIESPIELSRSLIEQKSGTSDLNRYGVSERSPVRLSPLCDTYWLIDPLCGSFFYLPISRRFVMALEGDFLRIVEGNNASEGRFSVKLF